MRRAITIFFCVLLWSCKKEYNAPIPDVNNWPEFNAPGAVPLAKTAVEGMEGIYDLTGPTAIFGDQVAIKSSYVITNQDTVWHVSIFCGTGISYFICEGRQVNGDILLNGYWRKMVSTETGIVRLTITAANGASILLGPHPIVGAGAVKIEGVYGNGDEIPNRPMNFVFNRKLNTATTFEVLAHRAGGRTSDLLPVSENSVAMILMAAEFGSTGVEIDIRLTRDDSLILYHDANINLRETQKSGLLGPIENFTYEQLSNLVRLVHGEKIPTLREALDAIVYRTPLTTVYLDTKITTPLDQLRALQVEYEGKAAAVGRHVNFLIGIPAQEQLDHFLSLPNYTSVPSLCELTIEDTRKVNAKVWAPRWTLGTQNEKVAEMHAEGRRVFVWTMDVPSFIDEYMDDGHFDGILTNFPSYVAYAHYIR
jgi:glycerophosphoryl diester phosphodiesterase